MDIRAVIFDIGGVIVRTEDHSSRRRLERQYGLTSGAVHDLVFESPVARQATYGRLPEKAVWDYVAGQLKLDPAQLEAFQTDFWAGDMADERLIEFIKSLRPRYKTALLSNAWSEARRLLNEKYRLEPMVDLLVVSAEERLAKPDSRIYELTAERLKIAVHEAVFIDDKAENIEAARRVGMGAVQFLTTDQLLIDLERLGVNAS